MKATTQRRQQRLVMSAANTRIYDLVRETSLDEAPRISALCNNRVLIKREDLQGVFSFKIRGAYHKIRRLDPTRLAHGVVAASAGNHAQGVAWAAEHMNCPAVIVMPEHTPSIKITAVRARGAKIILHGDSFDDSDIYARHLAKEKDATYIHPFDDEDVIAGNATIAAEILRQHQDDLHAIFCAIGGGGLISGVAAYVKMLRPTIRIIGVEAEESACMTESLKKKRRITLPHAGIFADAVAVKRPGRLTFELAQAFVDDTITVGNDALCAAVKDLYDDTRVIFEPAGALAVAGLKEYTKKNSYSDKSLVALACGANMNFDRLRFIAERAEIGENREAIFAITIPEKPGSFRRFCSFLGRRSVTEFNYRMADDTEAQIFVGLETQDSESRGVLLRKFQSEGLEAIDLTDDEMSKLHIRHMVGGRANVPNEKLYRFEFPERPGALIKFLDGINSVGRKWNISLFHYRNHGADTGRVLVGIQVPSSEEKHFNDFLRHLSYPHQCENDNPAYRLFLSALADE